MQRMPGARPPAMAFHPFWWLALALVLLAPWLARAATQPVPTDPILRIEGEMHTAIVRRLATDPTDTFLYSVSDDKTLRQWDLATGKAVKVFRVPISMGNDGKLFALDISPDGRHAAIAGWTGWEWDERTSIYLIDLNTGRLLHRLTGITNIVNHLVYSPDGRYLAAMLSGKNGLRVFRVADGRLVFQDTEYGDQSYWASFDPLGRLVTTCYDGYVRLYDNNFRLLAKRRPIANDRPYSAEFSPAGNRIAVGFQNTPQVMVLNGKTLANEYLPDVRDVNLKLHAVAWSRDAQYLFAGGLHERNGKRLVRKWSDGGQSSPDGQVRHVDLEIDGDTVMSLLPLKDGGLAVASADPSLLVYNADNTRRFMLERPTAVFRGIGNGLRINHDGSLVTFAYDPGGQGLASFDARALRLDPSPDSKSQGRPPIMQTPSTSLTGWRDQTGLKLNSIPLRLKNHEQSNSVAFAPDGKSFLLGTTFYLRLFTKDGNELWRQPAPATTWGVNVSGDGRWGVALFGDGTVRWFEMATGKPTLLLFPHNDRKRWVAWLPEGYYAASAGADTLVGWHKNSGRNELGIFYPVVQFNYVFHRPDLVRAALR